MILTAVIFTCSLGSPKTMIYTTTFSTQCLDDIKSQNLSICMDYWIDCFIFFLPGLHTVRSYSSETYSNHVKPLFAERYMCVDISFQNNYVKKNRCNEIHSLKNVPLQWNTQSWKCIVATGFAIKKSLGVFCQFKSTFVI